MSDDAKPAEAKPAEALPRPRIRYLYIYSFAFESPNWAMNLLYGFLCHLSGQFIPIVGPLVYLGYTFDVLEAIVRHPQETYPDFEPKKFGHYLQRSLPPFLVSLIFIGPAMLVGGLIFAVEFAAILAAAASGGGRNSAPFIVLGGFVLGFITVMGVVMLSFIPAYGFYLRSGLTQDLGQGMNLKWSLDFLKRTWFELFLLNMFNIVTLLPMMVLGFGCCFIGGSLVAALDSFATASSCAQLYNLYLARGGEPIPLKDPPLKVVPTAP